MYGEIAQKRARQTSPQGNPHLLGFFRQQKLLLPYLPTGLQPFTVPDRPLLV